MPTPLPYLAADGATTWRVRFRLAGRSSSETFKVHGDALRFCEDLDDLGPGAAVARRDEIARRHVEPSVGEVFAAFLEWKATRVRSDRTISDYRRDWSNWVGPTFDRRVISAVSPQDVQIWVDAMVSGKLTYHSRKALAAKSVIHRHSLLHGVFQYAVRRQLVPANPCGDTELPKKVQGSPKGLQPPEWWALATALRQVNPDAADLAGFLLASGWRWSEATALTTFDVEDDGERMWVTMGQVIRRDAANQFVVVEEGKGEGSLRRIEIDGSARQTIRDRVAATRPGELVFTTTGGSQWHYSNFRQRAWDPAVKVANLNRKPTPHWLRHTSVVWLARQGANLAELQSRIGHRNITTTINVYGRMLTDVSPDALHGFAVLRDGPAVAGIKPVAHLALTGQSG